MKNLLLTGLLFFSVSANADYFFCRITVDNQSAEYEADYRVFESTVSHAGFTCSGNLVEGGIVKVQITANGYPGWAIKSEGKLGCKLQTSTRNPDTNVGTDLTCECGLQ